jgi:hypothetical protein
MDAKPLNAIILAALNIQIFDLEFTYVHFSLLLKFAYIAPFSKDSTLMTSSSTSSTTTGHSKN